MDRIIKLSELREAVNEAYEEYKQLNDGTVDPRLKDADADAFAISVALTDGTVINKGDTGTKYPMGQVDRLAVTTLRVEQKSEQTKKPQCNCHGKDEKGNSPDIPFSVKGIRAISRLQPAGDPDSKWNFIENCMISLIGSAPTLNDSLYENLKKQAALTDTVNKIEQSGVKMGDDVAQSVDLYLRAMSMQVNTQQLAEMGATIAADGINPFTRQIVYDGTLSQKIVARIAMKGHVMRRFIMKSGLPATAGFGGAVVGILPGVFSIAAYSPRLCDNGVSIKGAKAIKYIMKKLGVSIFGSSHVVIEK